MSVIILEQVNKMLSISIDGELGGLPISRFRRFKKGDDFISIAFDESDFNRSIYPDRDTVTLDGITYASGSKTTNQMYTLLLSSEAFRKANSGEAGGPVSANDITETASRKFLTPEDKAALENLSPYSNSYL